MSNKVSFTIQFKDKFSATAKKLNRSLDSAKRKTDKLNKSISGRLTGGFKNLNKETVKAAKGLAIFATVWKTITAGAGFQTAIAELQAITGTEGAALKAMTEDILIASRKYGVAQDLVAQAFTQVASAKSELLDTEGGVATVTEQALLLSKAAGIELPDAIRASVGALNQWGMGADQAGRFVNVLAAGAKVGASTVGDTAQALKNAGSVAAQFGVSFEEANAMIQVLAKNEIKGAEAGTALRGTLSKLEKFMGGRFAPSKVGMIKSLEMLEKLGLSNAQVIKEFGLENLRSVLVLRKNIPLVKEWTNEISGTDEAIVQAALRMDTFSTKVSILGTRIKEMAIRAFGALEPMLNKVIDSINFMLDLIEGVIASFSYLEGKSFSEMSFAGLKDAFSSVFSNNDKTAETASKAEAAVQNPTPVGAQNAAAASAPTTPVAQNGTIAGTIQVSAAKGSEVKSTSMANDAPWLNIGMNNTAMA